MTTPVFKKLIIGTAIASSPFLFPAVASANSAPIVNPEAVNLLTISLRETVQAYDSLSAGDTLKAKTKLSSAVEKISSAATKDPQMGISTTTGAAKDVTALHSELKSVHARIKSGDTSDVRSELERVLSTTGML